MREYSRRIAMKGAGLALIACSAFSAVPAQAQNGEIRVYAGDPAQQTGLGIKGWGSGEAQESEDHVYIGSKSLKIVTHGLYQGVRLVLPTALKLKGLMDDKSAYLQFLVVLPSKDTVGRMGGDYFGGPGGLSGRGGRRGGAGGPGGLEGGQGGAGGTGETRLIKPKPLANLRIVLVTSDNKRTETLLPLDSAVITREDWSTVATPLVALTGLKLTNGELKEVDIFGDSPATIYLGEVRVLRDETPIRVDDLSEQTIAVNDTVTFVASADAGVTPLKYEWDFDASDGVNVDAEGRVVKHKYRKSPKDSKNNTVPITVTLTVSDPYGLKKSVVRTTKVYVTL